MGMLEHAAYVESLRTQLKKLQEQLDNFGNEILKEAPEDWDGEESQEWIAIQYVRSLEQKVVDFGGSLHRWGNDWRELAVEQPEYEWCWIYAPGVVATDDLLMLTMEPDEEFGRYTNDVTIARYEDDLKCWRTISGHNMWGNGGVTHWQPVRPPRFE